MQTEFAIAVSVVLPLWFCCIFCSHVLQNVPCQTCSSYCEWRVSPCFPSTRQSFPCSFRWRQVATLKTLPPCAQLADCMEEGLLQDAREAARGFAMFQASWEAAKSAVNPQAKREYDLEEWDHMLTKIIKIKCGMLKKSARCLPRQLGSIEGLSISPSAGDYSIHLS